MMISRRQRRNLLPAIRGLIVVGCLAVASNGEDNSSPSPSTTAIGNTTNPTDAPASVFGGTPNSPASIGLIAGLFVVLIIAIFGLIWWLKRDAAAREEQSRVAAAARASSARRSGGAEEMQPRLAVSAATGTLHLASHRPEAGIALGNGNPVIVVPPARPVATDAAAILFDRMPPSVASSRTPLGLGGGPSSGGGISPAPPSTASGFGADGGVPGYLALMASPRHLSVSGHSQTSSNGGGGGGGNHGLVQFHPVVDATTTGSMAPIDLLLAGHLHRRRRHRGSRSSGGSSADPEADDVAPMPAFSGDDAAPVLHSVAGGAAPRASSGSRLSRYSSHDDDMASAAHSSSTYHSVEIPDGVDPDAEIVLAEPIQGNYWRAGIAQGAVILPPAAAEYEAPPAVATGRPVSGAGSARSPRTPSAAANAEVYAVLAQGPSASPLPPPPPPADAVGGAFE